MCKVFDWNRSRISMLEVEAVTTELKVKYEREFFSKKDLTAW
jgi:hypothetical protein